MATHSSNLAWKIPWTEAGYSLWGHKQSDTTEQLTLLVTTEKIFLLKLLNLTRHMK